MKIVSLQKTFHWGGFHVMHTLRANPGGNPTLAEFPEFCQLGDAIREQQEQYGRRPLDDSEIGIRDLAETMQSSAQNLLERAARNRGYAEEHQLNAAKAKRSRNLLGGLSLASLALTPFGGGYTFFGALGVLTLGGAAILNQVRCNSHLEEQQSYNEAVDEQIASSEHLLELAQDLKSERLQWQVARQSQAPDHSSQAIELETFEDAVAVGDHILPVEFLH